MQAFNSINSRNQAVLRLMNKLPKKKEQAREVVKVLAARMVGNASTEEQTTLRSKVREIDDLALSFYESEIVSK